MKRTFALSAAALLATALWGCANSTDGPSRLDAGRSDTGGSSDCGQLGQGCCAGAMRCESGAVCGPSRSCCAVPGGAACRTQNDCCGSLDCLAGRCCAIAGSPCRSASECCGDATCTDSVCQMPSADCGGERQPCCGGTDCHGGFACVDSSCVPCGMDGQMCCRPPQQCATPDLVCNSGTCETPAADCGHDGQPCCGGSSCTGVLECMGGTCQAPSPTCTYPSCGRCTGSASRTCGWCGASNTCLVGDASGPSMGSCASGWQFGAGAMCTMDPDTCPADMDCAACTTDSSFVCGWCADSGTCHRGTSAGADDGSCMGTNWAWLSSQCGGMMMDTCSTNTACDACTTDSSFVCGWCADTGSCHHGSGTGPTDGSCSGTNWQWLSTECAGATDPCAGATACGACTAAGACGWCANTSSCRSGSSAGPTDASCSGAEWSWLASACSCSVQDAMCATASECCASLSCRAGVTIRANHCCVDVGDTCTGSSQCCGYMDCRSGMCECRAPGRACLHDNDCCSTTCTSGRCS